MCQARMGQCPIFLGFFFEGIPKYLKVSGIWLECNRFYLSERIKVILSIPSGHDQVDNLHLYAAAVDMRLLRLPPNLPVAPIVFSAE